MPLSEKQFGKVTRGISGMASELLLLLLVATPHLFAFDASGYNKLAFDCSLAFIWTREGASWRKIHELYPWRWAS